MVTSTDDGHRSRVAGGGPVAAVLVVAGVAWAVLSWAVVSGSDPLGGHGTGHHHHLDPGPLAAAPAMLTGWMVMVAAMMLPPALPLTTMLHRMLSARPDGGRLVASALGTFLAVWAAAGVVLITADALLRVLAGDGGDWAVSAVGGVLVLAGLYQFSSLKSACLRACRAPRWFARRYWHGRHPVREAAAVGGAYGVSCVGCCWALMSLCLVAGAAAMPAMVGLSVLMAAERLTWWGRRLVRPVGATFAVVGTGVLLGVVPAPVVHLIVGG